MSYSDFKDDVSYWQISKDIISEAWLNVLCSSIGYIMFAIMIWAMLKNKIFGKYKNNILLILTFAFITDIAELRINLILIGAEGTGGITYRNFEFVESSLASCTLARFSHYAQFLVTFIEAAVSIHMFVNRFHGTFLSIKYVYAGIGMLITVQIGIILATFAKGTPAMTMSNYCTREYLLPLPVMISIFCWALITFLAPVLCVIMIVKGQAAIRKDGIIAYILISSLCMTLLVLSFIIHNGTDSREDVVLGNICYFVFAIAGMIQEVRFLLLVILATIIIPEIRAAVFETVSRAVSKVLGYPEPQDEVPNNFSLRDLEANERNAILEMDQEY